MSTLRDYAEDELARLGKDEDGMQELMNKDILQIIDDFCKQNHSGFSASYAIHVLERLLRYLPLSPLTGEDDEWVKVVDGKWQNKRCHSVFKDANGMVSDIDAIEVSDNGGITWFGSGRFLKKDITFPYMPPTHPEKVYIEYTEDVSPGETGDEYEIITDNPERIKALYERKRKEFDEVGVIS